MQRLRGPFILSIERGAMSLYLPKGTEVSLDQLDRIQTPKPTRTWNPVPHSWFYGLVQDSIRKSGATIEKSEHGVVKGGDLYLGLIHLAPSKDVQSNGHHPMVGMANSHDKTVSMTVAVGMQVMICSNMSFFGEEVIRQKHYHGADQLISASVDEAVTKMILKIEEQENQIRVYKAIKFEDKQDSRSDRLILEAAQQRTISTRQIIPILDEWEKPSENNPEAEEKSVWGLFNAMSYVMTRSTSHLALPDRTIRLQEKVLNLYCLRALDYIQTA